MNMVGLQQFLHKKFSSFIEIMEDFIAQEQKYDIGNESRILFSLENIATAYFNIGIGQFGITDILFWYFGSKKFLHF